ncbi:hypothetical protein HK102_002191 [Quaeritorhiza haematococci]|nr:hypothetical protein HK102_002191 [Quaeritorhiza haematococci]
MTKIDDNDVHSTGVKKIADFSKIRYSQVWEDITTLRKGLRIKAGSNVLSIASAGDNAFALLLDDPAKVVAIDFSFPQLALCALKIVAYKKLSYDEFLHLFGFSFGEPIATPRRTLYQSLRDDLDEEYRAYWDHNLQTLETGIIHTGRLEKYFNLYNSYVLPLTHSRKHINGHLSIRNPTQQALNFDRSFASSWLWKRLLRFYFGEEMLGLLGRDRAFFKHVNLDVAETNLKGVSRCLRDQPLAAENFYVEYILTGNISGRCGLPDYLLPSNYAIIRSRIDRIELVQGDLKAYLAKPTTPKFDAFNLSDIFEWMDDKMYAETLRTIVQEGANPGAVLCYWNLFVLRERPDECGDILKPEKELAQELHVRQRTFMYRNFVVERVK